MILAPLRFEKVVCIMNVAIIIVNWNGKTDTLECLASLGADTYRCKQIIVVDNGSADDSVSAIRSAFPEVTVLETGTNLGFTGGNNVGINYALELGVDYIYLLNNDTTVEPNALAALVATAEMNPSYGLVTPVIHYFDRPEEVWFGGSLMDLSRGMAVHDNSHIPARTEAPREIPWASGCAMLVCADVVRLLGGFDDRYFLNWEDVDLSLRLRAAGRRIALVPSARIYHKVGRSFAIAKGTGCYYHLRNNLLLLALHGGCLARRAMFFVVASRLRETLGAIVNCQATPGETLPITIRAIRDHSRHRYGAVRK